MAADVMVCAQSAQVLVDDGDRLESVVVDRTTAHADHPIVTDNPHLWRPLVIDYPTSAFDPAAAEPEPLAKDVREWAADAGVEVSPHGKPPADVVEQYKAAKAEKD